MILKPETIKGLDAMMQNYTGSPVLRDISLRELDVLIGIAKRSDDLSEYFPHGKWATIQVLQREYSLKKRANFATAYGGPATSLKETTKTETSNEENT